MSDLVESDSTPSPAQEEHPAPAAPPPADTSARAPVDDIAGTTTNDPQGATDTLEATPPPSPPPGTDDETTQTPEPPTTASQEAPLGRRLLWWRTRPEPSVAEMLMSLRRSYLGVRGSLVFLVGTFTLLPFLIQLKFDVFQLNVSLSTLIFVAYHGVGIINWIDVRQLTRQESDFTQSDHEKQCVDTYRRHRRLFRPLSVATFSLLALIFFAKVNLVWGDEEDRFNLPSVVYKILGIPQPPSPPPLPRGTSCQSQILAKIQTIEKTINHSTAPCDSLTPSNFEPVLTMQECSRVRETGKICVASTSEDLDPTQLTPLKDEMWASLFRPQNPRIFALLERAAQMVNSDHEGRGLLVLVQGPAGSGKSNLLQGGLQLDASTRSESAPASKFYTYRARPPTVLQIVDLAKVFCDTKAPDLLIPAPLGTEVPVNSLCTSSEDTATTKIHDILVEAGRAGGRVLILDSFDEIHPDTRDRIISQVYEHLNAGSVKSVFILGRPESLILAPGDHAHNFDHERESLAFPSYTSAEAVAARWNNWVLYRRERWAVKVAENTSIQDVITLMKRSPTVCSSFQHLVVSAWIIDHGREWLRGDQIVDEAEIQSALLDELLKRNEDTHGRPTTQEGQYFELLESFVVDHLTYSTADSFRISPHALRLGDGPRATSVLHHSGLIDISPVDTALYRFQPSWVPVAILRRALPQRCGTSAL